MRLPDNPGPPRANAALSSVAGSLFLLGGMSFVPNTTAAQSKSARPTPMTTVDNWRYDPEQAAWHRLPDLPVASGNFQTNGCVPRALFLLRRASHVLRPQANDSIPRPLHHYDWGLPVSKHLLLQQVCGSQLWNTAAHVPKCNWGRWMSAALHSRHAKHHL